MRELVRLTEAREARAKAQVCEVQCCVPRRRRRQACLLLSCGLSRARIPLFAWESVL